MKVYITLLISLPFLFAQIAQNCTKECASQYIFPSERPQPCCGCCPSSQCHEIPELTLCCASNRAFCGCLSYRAACTGEIFNGPAPYSTFGTCYDPNDPATATCTYSPGPNTWIICPSGYTACSSSYLKTCCSPGTVCNSTESSSYPQCVPVSSQQTRCQQDYECASLGDAYSYSICQNGYCACRYIINFRDNIYQEYFFWICYSK